MTAHVDTLTTNDENTAERTNIVLIGMPGAGKSTLGVVLAKVMGLDFVDCDLVIQRAHGRTLQQIIDERGVGEFLRAEEESLCGIDVRHSVVSTGGSAVYSPGAMAHLARTGVVVYLHVPFPELGRRLGSLHERGVVMRDGVSEDLAAIFAERAPLYEQYAELTFEVDDPDIRTSALALAARLREQM